MNSPSFGKVCPFLFFFIFFGITKESFPGIIHVGAGPNQLQRSIDAAQDGDTLIVPPRRYLGMQIIDKSLMVVPRDQEFRVDGPVQILNLSMGKQIGIKGINIRPGAPSNDPQDGRLQILNCAGEILMDGVSVISQSRNPKRVRIVDSQNVAIHTLEALSLGVLDVDAVDVSNYSPLGAATVEIIRSSVRLSGVLKVRGIQGRDGYDRSNIPSCVIGGQILQGCECISRSHQGEECVMGFPGGAGFSVIDSLLIMNMAGQTQFDGIFGGEGGRGGMGTLPGADGGNGGPGIGSENSEIYIGGTYAVFGNTFPLIQGGNGGYSALGCDPGTITYHGNGGDGGDGIYSDSLSRIVFLPPDLPGDFLGVDPRGGSRGVGGDDPVCANHRGGNHGSAGESTRGAGIREGSFQDNPASLSVSGDLRPGGNLRISATPNLPNCETMVFFFSMDGGFRELLNPPWGLPYLTVLDGGGIFAIWSVGSPGSDEFFHFETTIPNGTLCQGMAMNFQALGIHGSAMRLSYPVSRICGGE